MLEDCGLTMEMTLHRTLKDKPFKKQKRWKDSGREHGRAKSQGGTSWDVGESHGCFDGARAYGQTNGQWGVKSTPSPFPLFAVRLSLCLGASTPALPCAHRATLPGDGNEQGSRTCLFSVQSQVLTPYEESSFEPDHWWHWILTVRYTTLQNCPSVSIQGPAEWARIVLYGGEREKERENKMLQTCLTPCTLFTRQSPPDNQLILPLLHELEKERKWTSFKNEVTCWSYHWVQGQCPGHRVTREYNHSLKVRGRSDPLARSPFHF